MRLSLTALIRCVSYLAVFAVVGAAGLARITPVESLERHGSSPGLSAVPLSTGGHKHQPGLIALDVRKGQIVSRDLGPGERLDLVSASPWIEPGQGTQIVGRYSRFEQRDGQRMLDVSGLARLRYPSLEPIDLVETRVPLLGPACWKPSTRAEVIYPGADGRLYHLDLDQERTEPIRPTPVSWDLPAPAESLVDLNDPAWPGDPRFDGRLLVAVHTRKAENGRLLSQPVQIWWIRLDATGTSVTEAAPITETTTDVIKRSPTLVPLPDGRLALAYLGRDLTSSWKLMLVPLEFDPETEAPIAVRGREQVLDDHCLAPGLAVSTDQRRLFYHRSRPIADGGAVPRQIDLDRLQGESCPIPR